MPAKPDPRVDAYIARSADFARPILRHLRALVHAACPAATETVKWGMPFFMCAGKPLCHFAAFRAHGTFGFWHRGMVAVLGKDGAHADEAMGNLGRLTGVADLPSDAALRRHLRAAVRLNEAAGPVRVRAANVRKIRLVVPRDLAAALRTNAAAARTFRNFSPAHRREYLEWITGAKRAETRQRRVATTVTWLAEGKSHNWKYTVR